MNCCPYRYQTFGITQWGEKAEFCPYPYKLNTLTQLRKEYERVYDDPPQEEETQDD